MISYRGFNVSDPYCLVTLESIYKSYVQYSQLVRRKRFWCLHFGQTFIGQAGAREGVKFLTGAAKMRPSGSSIQMLQPPAPFVTFELQKSQKPMHFYRLSNYSYCLTSSGFLPRFLCEVLTSINDCLG